MKAKKHIDRNSVIKTRKILTNDLQNKLSTQVIFSFLYFLISDYQIPKLINEYNTMKNYVLVQSTNIQYC